MVDTRIRNHPLPLPPVQYEEDELISDSEAVHARTNVAARASEEVESEEGAESTAEDERERKREVKSKVDQRRFPPLPSSHPYPITRHMSNYHYQQHPPHHYKSRSAPTVYETPTTGYRYAGGSISQAIPPPAPRSDHRNPYLGRPLSHTITYSSARYPYSSRPKFASRPSLDEEIDVDADGEADMDADGDAEVDERQNKRGLRSPPIIGGSSTLNLTRSISRRQRGLADLDSSAGR